MEDWADEDTLKRLKKLEEVGQSIAGPNPVMIPNKPLPPPILPPPGSKLAGGVDGPQTIMDALKKKPLWGE